MNDVNDEKLRKTVDALPREIAPGRDLWPGISARIARQALPLPRRSPWPYALAASLFVAVFAGGLWFSLDRHAPGATTPAPQLAAASPDAQYFARRAAFAENTVQNAPDLTPATRAVILKNLRIIEGSMQQIQGALEKDPSNPRLRTLLYDLYQNEARLLAATQQIQAQTTMRNDL